MALNWFNSLMGLYRSHPKETLFVPFAGNANNGSVNNTGNEGFVWSSSLNSSNVNNAFNLNVNDKPDAVLNNNNRYIGRSVRGVVQHWPMTIFSSFYETVKYVIYTFP